MASPVRLNRAGIGRVLKSRNMSDLVQGVAEKVADNVDGQELTAQSPGQDTGTAITADVETYTTDRAAAAVVIRHPAAAAMQAKHGVLTRAAAEAGLEIRGDDG